MPSRAVGFIKSLFPAEIDVVAANKLHQAQLNFTADELSERFFGAVATGEPVIILACIQALEAEICDDYRWPWLFWPMLARNNAAYGDILPADAPRLATNEMLVAGGTLPVDVAPIDGAKSGPNGVDELAQEIYQAAFQVRSGDLTTLSRFFKDPEQTIEAAVALPLAMQVELIFYAMSEKCWPAIEALTARQLKQWQTGQNQLHDRLAELFFDLNLRALFRQAMPSFVNRPTDLTDRLDVIATNDVLLDKLGRNSSAVGYFMAAQKSLAGDVEGSITLYDQVNRSPGFRSPIFNPAQTVVPIRSIEDADEAQLLRWFAKYSNITHHYRHDPGAEHVVLVGSEQHYLDRYGELYAETLGMTNPGALVHFHFVSLTTPKVDILALLDGWQVKYGLRINCSFEENSILRQLTPYTAAISMTTRFVYLPDYMETYTSLTLTDIDGWLTAPIEKLSAFEENDTLISSWIWRKNTGRWRLPWANLAAGYISFKSTANSQKFHVLLRKYIITVTRDNVMRGRNLVYTDQSGLFLSLLHGCKTWGHKVGFLPPAGFKQSFEQREEFRFEGKKQAMKEKLAELKAARTETRTS